MNGRIRGTGAVLIILFVGLFANLNYLQVFQANELATHPGNGRFLVKTYGSPRGEIVSADGKVLAESEETADEFKRKRVYPAGPLLSHVVGWLAVVEGATGLELSQAQRLLGDRRTADNIWGYFFGEAEPGTVRITIDTRVQQAARAALGDQSGAVAALDPRTGAVLALWSNPSYDPNPIASHDLPAAAAAAKAANEGDKPGLERAFAETYPPGSTFKVVTAAAALRSGIRPDAAFANPLVLELTDSTVGLRNFGGGRCRPDAGDRVTFRAGFLQSCNTTFAQVGLQVGADALRRQADLFGFNRAVPLEVGTEPSVFPPASEFEQAQSSLAQAAIGQFDVRVTPLQMAMVAAAVANDGVVMRPHLVAEVLDEKRGRSHRAMAEQYSVAMPAADAAVLRDLMVAVVESGTGGAAQIEGVTVGGKTGTAEAGEGRPPHAWFVAFAPAEDPVVAVAVVVENGGSLGSEATGGQVAAPLAREVIEAVLALKG